VNTSSTTARKVAGIDLDETPITIVCAHPACDDYATGHEAPAFDPSGVMHKHAGPWEQAPGKVDCYFDHDLDRWHASAYLDDADRPLTADEVHAFTAAWDQAYARAQTLNESEVPC
jgi:hypothetical protein